VYDDVTLKYAGKRFELEVALWWLVECSGECGVTFRAGVCGFLFGYFALVFLPVIDITLSFYPRGSITGDVSHAC